MDEYTTKQTGNLRTCAGQLNRADATMAREGKHVSPESNYDEGEPRRRGRDDNRGRLLWWLAAGLPSLLAFALLELENYQVPDLSQRRDISAILLLLVGVFLTGVGVAMAVSAIHRGQQAIEFWQRTSGEGSRSELLEHAHEIRLRAGWLILVGAGLAAFGLCLIGSFVVGVG